MPDNDLNTLGRLNLSLSELFAERFPDAGLIERAGDSDFLREFTLLDILLQPEATWRELSMNRRNGSFVQRCVWDCFETTMKGHFGGAWSRAFDAERAGWPAGDGLPSQIARAAEFWRPRSGAVRSNVVNLARFLPSKRGRERSTAAPGTAV